MAYRLTSTGATDNRTFYLYGYSFALNSAKTVQSITLPNNRNVVVLAIDVVPAAAGPSARGRPTMSPSPATYTSAQSVTLADTHAGRADLLHHQRHHPEHELFALQSGHAAADQLHHHRQSDRDGERL